MSPRALRRSAVLLLVLAGILPGGCAAVDATGDLSETAQLVRERTGGSPSEDPRASDEVIQAAVDGMLAAGLTVDEAVRVALLCNPVLRARYEDVGIRKAELVAAGLPRNPFVSVSARFPDGGGPVDLTASITQSLVDLFLIPARRRAGAARLSMARWRVVQEAVELAGKVESEAFDLLALERGRTVADESLALAQRSLAVAERRLQAGLGDAVDVQLARNGVLAATRERLDVDRDIAIRRAVLQELLGLSPFAREWEITGELPSPRRPEHPQDPESLVRRALARRLEIRVAELQVEAARGDLEIQQDSRVQDLSVGVEGERPEAPPSVAGPVVEGSLPLWSRNEPAVARGEFLLAQAEDELRSVRNSVAREAREAIARLESAQRLVALFEGEILPQARTGVDVSQRAWQAGEREVVVLLEAQRFLLEERRAYVAAIRDAARARAALDVVLGGPGDGDASPEETTDGELGEERSGE